MTNLRLTSQADFVKSRLRNITAVENAANSDKGPSRPELPGGTERSGRTHWGRWPVAANPQAVRVQITGGGPPASPEAVQGYSRWTKNGTLESGTHPALASLRRPDRGPGPRAEYRPPRVGAERAGRGSEPVSTRPGIPARGDGRRPRCRGRRGMTGRATTPNPSCRSSRRRRRCWRISARITPRCNPSGSESASPAPNLARKPIPPARNDRRGRPFGDPAGRCGRPRAAPLTPAPALEGDGTEANAAPLAGRDRRPGGGSRASRSQEPARDPLARHVRPGPAMDRPRGGVFVRAGRHGPPRLCVLPQGRGPGRR